MRSDVGAVSGGKKAAFAVLLLTAAAICISGVWYFVYSLAYGIWVPVLNAKMPGAVLGAAVLYLGIRYLLMLFRLKKELYKPESKFSWDNLKKRGHDR